MGRAREREGIKKKKRKEKKEKTQVRSPPNEMHRDEKSGSLAGHGVVT